MGPPAARAAPGRPPSWAGARAGRESERFHPYTDYGAIGNLQTAALVSRFGSIDWACLPSFASPSVFGRILDSTRGGYHGIRPRGPSRSTQRYRPYTNILETLFELPDGRRLEVVDFMPIADAKAPHASTSIVRIASAFGGEVPISTVCAPRFEYGRRSPKWIADRGAWLARDHVGVLAYDHPWKQSTSDGAARSTGVVQVGVPVAIRLRWGETPRPTDAPEEQLRSTEAFWRAWVHGPGTPLHALSGEWHDWVTRSELLLKLLTYAETGAFVAAPTTSLPEWPGGRRNWDYRYVWVRDAAFTAQAFLLLGHVREARAFLLWVLDRLRETKEGQLGVVYGANGERDLRERALRHLSGYRDSRPVRVGNGAVAQFQLDVYGEFFDAVALLADLEPEPVAQHWEELARLADQVVQLWRSPDHGIWEIRGPKAQYVHSKLMAWVALDRSVRLAARFGGAAERERWSAGADEIRRWMLDEGYDRRRANFRQSAGRSEVDAANLRIPLVGFLPFDDERIRGTLASVRERLCTGPFVYRYQSGDYLPGPEGVFLPASFWWVECQVRAGDRGRAVEQWEELLATGRPLGLFPEEYDPKSRRGLGNFPQAFTHIALLRSALALGVADSASAPSASTPSGLPPAR